MIIKSHLLGNFLNGLIKLIFYPIITVGKIVNKAEDKVPRLFVRANNYLTFHRRFNYRPEEILLLLPHCLQNSDCIQKITKDIKNCKGCGKCQICQLVELNNCYPAHFHVVDGGTMARNRLKSGNYKAVVAVACERELESGIYYSNLPVIAIVNERPKGPCTETCVNIPQVERALLFFFGELTDQTKGALNEVKSC
jgi:hypothetical protein